MQASIPSIVGQMIVFAIFVWFTMKFVWPPITKALAERQAKIADGLAAADRGQKALEEASKHSEVELKQARVQAQDIVGAAGKQATQMIEQAKLDAEAEKARIVAAGHAEVERQLSQARDALRRQVGELAVAGAARILKREIDAKAHADLIGDLAARV
jgi:F-type H+-transporting ATPase subunit b